MFFSSGTSCVPNSTSSDKCIRPRGGSPKTEALRTKSAIDENRPPEKDREYNLSANEFYRRNSIRPCYWTNLRPTLNLGSESGNAPTHWGNLDNEMPYCAQDVQIPNYTRHEGRGVQVGISWPSPSSELSQRPETRGRTGGCCAVDAGNRLPAV